jgi:hypothetical protein
MCKFRTFCFEDSLFNCANPHCRYSKGSAFSLCRKHAVQCGGCLQRFCKDCSISHGYIPRAGYSECGGRPANLGSPPATAGISHAPRVNAQQDDSWGLIKKINSPSIQNPRASSSHNQSSPGLGQWEEHDPWQIVELAPPPASAPISQNAAAAAAPPKGEWKQFTKENGQVCFLKPVTTQISYLDETTGKICLSESVTEDVWEQHTDPDGKPYYWNPSTNESTYTHPTQLLTSRYHLKKPGS